MFFKRTEKAVADWPKMAIDKRKGIVRLHGKYAGPSLDGWAGLLFVIAVMVTIVMAIQKIGTWEAVLVVAASMIIPWFFLGRSIVIGTFGRNLDVRILPEVIQVKRKKYDRDAVRGFRMERHHTAVKEVREERRTGKRSGTTYREALEVVMDYGEKRIPIAAMPDKDERRAEALMYRLQDVHDNLELILGGEDVVGGTAPTDNFGKPPDIR